jgi:S-(hydroxymethyl)glutathione dehydrogenase/alcohol dehydrogenase
VTDFLVAGERTAKEVRGLTGGRGADQTFDCVGRPATIRTAWSSARRGGTVTVVGVGGQDMQVVFSALELHWSGRTLHCCVYGSSDPDRDVPRLLDLVGRGELDLAALTSGSGTLAEVNDAFDALRAGRGARTVIRFDQ